MDQLVLPERADRLIVNGDDARLPVCVAAMRMLLDELRVVWLEVVAPEPAGSAPPLEVRLEYDLAVTAAAAGQSWANGSVQQSKRATPQL